MSKQIPFVDYLVLGDDPHIEATECSHCGALYLDRRNACAKCGRVDGFTKRRLADSGVLRSFSIVHRAAPGVTVPYVSAIVDLDGGGTVKANLVEVSPDPEHVSLGMPLQMTTFTIGTDPEGTEAVSFGFRPATAA